MINFDYITKENTNEHNSNRPEISDHPFKILIIGDSESGKTNSLFKIIGHQPDINQIYLYAKNPLDSKY